VRLNPRVWHFAFHSARDIAELLVSGRERAYLQAFFYARSFDPSVIDLDAYVSAYSAPGAMRAGFELYRAFERDADDNRKTLRRNGKLTIPVLAIWGAISSSGPLLEEMMHGVAEDVSGLHVPRTAHWIAEENPSAFLESVIKFLQHANSVPTTN
jgi:pimeloyl-ACP methyl ester carboxylesterase